MDCAIRIRMAWALLASLVIAAALDAQEVGYNDLTTLNANPLKHRKFTPDRSCNGGSGGGLGAGFGCPPQTYPFELSLLNMDTSELVIGGEVLALLRLRNVGHDPAVVPWSTDSEQIELPDESGTFTFSQADLDAEIQQEGGRSAYFSIPVHLYGARKVPGSLQEIRPGEFVEMRVKLVLDIKNEGVSHLRAGQARLSFTWTEWDSKVKYEKCSVQTFQSRTRELSSDRAVIDVVRNVPLR